MDLVLLVFYALSAVCVASATMVVASRNPVHAVLFLILTFFNAAGLFILLGAEFLAMVLVVVYVGAVAVLFIFVVMMIDIDLAQMRAGFIKYLPVGALIGLVLLAELVLVLGTWGLSDTKLAARTDIAPSLDMASNTEALGRILYTDYVYVFQIAGLILLVAIIGAITLTLRDRGVIKRQDIGEQVHRDYKAAIELRKVTPGSGIG
ncbi:MAG: NADH-quinone oxidoreductase subunit J [Geminicoccaceae bacterium]